MTLPDTLALWASAATYSVSGGPTKSALSSGRLAEGYVPLAHAIAAQEANEYLHRMGTVVGQHRAQHVSVADRVPGIDGTVTHPLVTQFVGGTATWTLLNGGTGNRLWGWKVNSGDLAQFKLEIPPLARIAAINAKVRGVGAYVSPGWTGTIILGQSTPGSDYADDYSSDAMASGAGGVDWDQMQLDGVTYSPTRSTFNRIAYANITAAADLLVVGFEADFEPYS